MPSTGDFGSSVVVVSAVAALGSGVPVAEVDVSGSTGVEVLGTSGVFLPDLLSLLRSRFFSFFGPCFSFSLSVEGVPLSLGVEGAGLAGARGGGVEALDLLERWGGRGFSGAGGAGVGCLVGG